MDEENQASRQQRFANSNNATSFHNPVFQSTLDVTQLESTNLDLSPSKPLDETKSSTRPASRPDYLRRQSSMLTREIDKVFFGHVFSIKTRTYFNFQKFLRMMLPVLILLVMVLLLIFVFRLNVTITDNGDVEQ